MADLLTIEIAGETVQLFAAGAMYWPRRETLLVADMHWGKAETFRRHGIPVPAGTTSDSLNQLDQLIATTSARRLVFLGDLLHARAGRSHQLMQQLSTWRQRQESLELLLVRGNHDRGAGDPPGEWRIEAVDEPYSDGPFVYRHFPNVDSAGYVLAGHVHPVIKLAGAGRQSLTLSCFHFTANVGTLPAFGPFTGGGRVNPAVGDRCYVLAGERVVECWP